MTNSKLQTFEVYGFKNLATNAMNFFIVFLFKNDFKV
jgi:hypothetical protein